MEIKTTQTTKDSNTHFKITDSSCGSPFDHKATFTLTSQGFDKHRAVEEMNKAIDYMEAELKTARAAMRDL